MYRSERSRQKHRGSRHKSRGSPNGLDDEKSGLYGTQDLNSLSDQ